MRYLNTSIRLIPIMCVLLVVVACGKDGGEMVQEEVSECQYGIEQFAKELEQPAEVNFTRDDCPDGINFEFSGTYKYSSPVFSLFDSNKAVFLRQGVSEEVDNTTQLVHFDFCTGVGNILDQGEITTTRLGQVQWTQKDWIYYTKNQRYFRIQGETGFPGEIDIPASISKLKWHPEGHRVAYRRALPSGQALILAAEDFMPFDTIQNFSYAFDWGPDNTIVYQYKSDEEPSGIYSFNYLSKTTKLLHPNEDEIGSVFNIRFLKDSDEILWNDSDSFFTTNATTGTTTQIFKSEFAGFYRSISIADNYQHLLVTRDLIEDATLCNIKSSAALLFIDLEMGTEKRMDVEQ